MRRGGRKSTFIIELLVRYSTCSSPGIGGTSAQIKAAYPKAKVDHGTEDVFGITLAKIPKDGGGRIHFAVDVRSKKITRIGVPSIPFCE